MGHLDAAKYEARVAAAIRFGKVPEGKQLITEGGRWSNEYVVRLRDAPEWLNAVLEPVPIPTTLRNPHPVVVALQQPDTLRGIDRSARQRALLIIQSLAVESSRRGYTVKATEMKPDRYGYQRVETKDHFSIAVGNDSFSIEFRQSVDRIPHEPTKAELHEAERHSWYSLPKFDVKPGDRLSLQISGPHEHRQSKWADSATDRLEEHLAQILQEIELRAEAGELARLAAIAAAAERHRQWEQAMERAKLDYREATLAQTFEREVSDWLRVNQNRSYLSEMKSLIHTMDPVDAIRATEWFEWASKWVESLDPFQRQIGMPTVPVPKSQDLVQFLHSWSPYGP